MILLSQKFRKGFKTKSFLSPWITKGIQISEWKLKLYETFLKKWTYASEKIYKHCKNRFKNLRNISNKWDCKSQFLSYESGDKKHLEYNLKSNQQKGKSDLLFHKIETDTEIKNNLLIAKKFSSFFADTDPKLASEIHQLINQYLQYINVASSLLRKI